MDKCVRQNSKPWAKYNSFNGFYLPRLDQKDFVLPILSVLSDRKPYTTSKLNNAVTDHFSLSEDQKM